MMMIRYSDCWRSCVSFVIIVVVIILLAGYCVQM